MALETLKTTYSTFQKQTFALRPSDHSTLPRGHGQSGGSTGVRPTSLMYRSWAASSDLWALSLPMTPWTTNPSRCASPGTQTRAAIPLGNKRFLAMAAQLGKQIGSWSSSAMRPKPCFKGHLAAMPCLLPYPFTYRTQEAIQDSNVFWTAKSQA
jgi:hypothetical protein